MRISAKGVLLDTSVVIRHLRDRNAIVAKLLEYEEICLPYVALAELYAGAYRSSRPEWHLDQISRFQEAVDLILPDDATFEFYGRISAQLIQTGTPIPQNDIWIAAIALQTGLPLATADKHFGMVKGLSVLLW
jgi:tRNA(fMet)-specific endonuclease VapC